MFDLSALMHGLGLGLAVFVAPGPKDIVILRETLVGQSPARLIAIAVLSDIILMSLGVLGFSALLQQIPSLRLLAQGLGIGLLLLHGVQAARAALRGRGPSGAEQPCPPLPDGAGLRRLLVVSLLNPAVWLDTLLVIGTVGATPAAPLRFSFATGAATALLIWFCLWVSGARSARRLMSAPNAWRLLDAGVAIAMIAMAVLLALSL